MARSVYMEREQAQAVAAVAVAAAALSLEGAGRARFDMLPLSAKQSAIVEDPSRFTITEATTKAGKTMSHLEWLLWSGIGVGEGNWWWVAPSSTQARIAFDRAKDRLNGYISKPLPDGTFARVKVAEPIPFVHRSSPEMEILCCGARFQFRTAEKPDLLYGDDVRGMVGDEITRWRQASWTACYTTLTATKGRAKLIGNVKGKRNFAAILARKAEQGESDWGYHRLDAYDAAAFGLIDPDVIEQAKRDLTDAEFSELYLAIPAMDSGNPFGDISACIGPMSNGAPVVWGWDLAKSVDWTVGIALDRDGRVCRFDRWQKRPWSETLRDIARTTGPAYVDATGVGDPIVEQLQAERGNVVGVKFTQQSKQQLMEGLKLAIQRRQVTFPSGPISIEMEAFEYEYTRNGVHYSAPEGMHDDCVCALALAVSGFVFGPREAKPADIGAPDADAWLPSWA